MARVLTLDENDVATWEELDGSSPLTVVPFSLTAAQIKGAGAGDTPAVLAPAPGTSKIIIPIGGICIIKFGTVPFPGDTSHFGIGGVGVSQSGLWNKTVDQTMHLGGPEGQLDLSVTENAPTRSPRRSPVRSQPRLRKTARAAWATP